MKEKLVMLGEWALATVVSLTALVAVVELSAGADLSSVAVCR